MGWNHQLDTDVMSQIFPKLWGPGIPVPQVPPSSLRRKYTHAKARQRLAEWAAMHLQSHVMLGWKKCDEVTNRPGTRWWFKWERRNLITLPETNSLHLKSYHPKRKIVFQASIFRGYVKLRGCTLPETNIAPENQWLEDKISFLVWSMFRVFLVSGST